MALVSAATGQDGRAAGSTARPGQGAYSPEEIAVAVSKLIHDQLHDEWMQHERHCVRCIFGYPCRVALDLADAADDAGKRWRLAEDRERAGRRGR